MQRGELVSEHPNRLFIALAGALAEAGITSLELNGERLLARGTDLPGLLRAAGSSCVLRAGEVGTLVLEPGRVSWQTVSDELHAALERARRCISGT